MIALVIDGGGTKTRAWLADSEQRRAIANAESTASNFGQVGADGLRSVLEDLVAKLPHSSKIEAAILGLAGVGRETERQRALAVANEVFRPAPVRMLTDAELAYHGAFPEGKHGILLIAGTGSIAFYRTPIGQEFARAGGWGPLLGDEGGGVWLGREVLRHCLLEWEQDELSEFHAAVLAALEVEETPEILTAVYARQFGPAQWSKLAPLVFEYAQAHPSAMRILKRMAIEMIELVERLAERLAPEVSELPFVVMGGLWERRAVLQPLFEEEIRLRNLPLIITEPAGGPLEGGLNLLDEMRKHVRTV